MTETPDLFADGSCGIYDTERLKMFTVKLRSDNYSSWVKINPILENDETCFVKDKKAIVFGDGVTPFTGLPLYKLAKIQKVINTVKLMDYIEWCNKSDTYVSAMNSCKELVNKIFLEV